MAYTVSLKGSESPKLVIVGCGGTGSLAAEGLCRLLIRSDLTLMLVDFDRVESHNLLRQNFFPGEVDKFKERYLLHGTLCKAGTTIPMIAPSPNPTATSDGK